MKKLVLILLSLANLSALAETTVFTYQGRLNENGAAANSTNDFRFRLYSDAIGNNQVSTNSFAEDISVSNGVFVISLDFGSSAFDGSERWLEIGVRAGASFGPYTPLTPLQRVTPTPYAIRAAQAATAVNVTGNISDTQLSGNIARLNAAQNFSGPVTFSNASGTFTGNGAFLTNVNASSLNGLAATSLWKTTGNTGTGGAFIGTTDFSPIELRVNNVRGLRIDPVANSASVSGAVNVVGGSPANFIGANRIGSTIAGGGAVFYSTGSASNTVLADFGTIGGGANNSIQGDYATISGGARNTIGALAQFSIIGGGINNTIESYAHSAAINGGDQNLIGYASSAFIGGGYFNRIQTGADYSIIGGGSFNTNIGIASVIPGGDYNVAGANSFAAGHRAKATHAGTFVWSDLTEEDFGSSADNQFLIRAAGGVGIGTNNPASTLHVAGVVTANAFAVHNSSITTENQALEFRVNNMRALRIEPKNDTLQSHIVNVIAGSSLNFVANNVSGATIAGGGAGNFFGSTYSNTVLAHFGVIGGGLQNTIKDVYSTISGGVFNTIETNAHRSAIGGGHGNTIQTNAAYSIIGGGYQNVAEGTHASIGGGDSNRTTGPYGVVPGGRLNEAFANAFAAGFSAKARHNGTFVWSDPSGGDFASTANNQFLIRASGGVGINKNNPATALDVNGTVTATAFKGKVQLANDASSATAFNAGSLRWTGSSVQLSDGLTWQSVATLSGNQNFAGNVGIGISPAAKLHVSGTAQTVGVFDSSNTGGTWVGIGNTAASGQRWSLISTGNGNSEGAGRLLFFTSQDNSTKMRLEPNGNLVINGTLTQSSDKNIKTNFATVNAREVLEKVAALPITTWAYKDDAETKHIGPMAQDFHAAFQVGPDDKHITTVDEGGVALAAIQGLNEVVKEKNAEIQELKERLSALEKLVSTLAK